MVDKCQGASITRAKDTHSPKSLTQPLSLSALKQKSIQSPQRQTSAIIYRMATYRNAHEQGTADTTDRLLRVFKKSER